MTPRHRSVLGLALVPAAWLISLALPSEPGVPLGVSVALGCGGGVHVPKLDGWTWLKPSMMSNTDRPHVAVATDGFFVIDAEGRNLSADAALASMQLKVTDALGAEVPGELKLLHEMQADWYLFSWVAAAPLAKGATLTATLSAAPASNAPVGGTFPLVVEGDPTPLVAPELALEGWRDFFHGTGDWTASCPIPYPCGATSYVFPAQFTKMLAANAVWDAPKVSGGVAWHINVDASAQTESMGSGEAYFFADAPQLSMDLGRMLFQQAAPEYCVTVTLTDLRTGEERQSDACSPAETPQGADSDSSAVSCDQPPSAELTEGWCRVRQNTALEACAPYLSSAGGSRGSGGSAPIGAGGSSVGAGAASSDAGTGPNPGGVAGSSTGDSGNDSARTSRGCQTHPGGTAMGSGALLLVAVVGACYLRRRRWPMSGPCRAPTASSASP